MNGRAFLKNILLLIMLTISCFFLLVTYADIHGIEILSLYTPITIALNIVLLEEKRYQKNRCLQLLFILLTVLNISWFIYHTYEQIHYYIQWNNIDISIPYLYSIIIFSTTMTSLTDIKKDTHILNDFLTILTTILIILIHYRYYLDKNFLHNFISNANNSYVLQGRYTYITQYYIYFIFMYSILFIQKKINNISNKTSASFKN